MGLGVFLLANFIYFILLYQTFKTLSSVYSEIKKLFQRFCRIQSNLYDRHQDMRYIYIKYSETLEMLLVYIINSLRPSVKLCGTPQERLIEYRLYQESLSQNILFEVF